MNRAPHEAARRLTDAWWGTASWVFQLGALSLVGITLAACGGSSSTLPGTLAQVRDAPLGADDAGCLIVFLPGAGDEADDYVEHGFFSEVRRAGVDADLVAANVTVPYYRADNAIERIYEDVLEPAKRAGYERVWVVGISMGGGGALRVAATHTDDVAGVVLLAPLIGGPGLFRDVLAVGGPQNFEPDDELRRTGGPFVDAWHWAGHRERADGSVTPLYLAYGFEDPLARMSETLALALPESHVIRGGGGHRWVVWQELWRGLVAGGFLQRSCGVLDPAADETETEQ